MKNKYTYETVGGRTKGAFNIYQAKNGSIQLLMCSKSITLTREQIKQLPIHPYDLMEFSHKDYIKFYNI